MSGRNADSKLREELNRFVGPRPPGGRWSTIQAEAARRRRRDLVLKAVAVPVSLLLIAALCYLAVDALRGEPMVVIDDSPGEIAGAGTTDGTDAAGEGGIGLPFRPSDDGIFRTIEEFLLFVNTGEIDLPAVITPPWSDATAPGLSHLFGLAAFKWVDLDVQVARGATQEDLERLRESIESHPDVRRHSYITSQRVFMIYLRVSPESPPKADEFMAVMRRDPAVEVVHRPPATGFLAARVAYLLEQATAKTPEAEKWLAEQRSSLVETEFEQDEPNTDPFLRRLAPRLEEEGVPIVSVEWKLPSEIENWGGDKHLTIVVEGSDDHADQIAHRHAVERETSRASLQGVVLDGIHLYSRDTDGTLEYQTGWAPAGYAEASFWRETPEASLDTVADTVGRLIEHEAAQAGLEQPELEWEEDLNSYDVTISVMKGDATRQSLESFVAKVHAAVFEHNRDRGFNLASTRYLVTQGSEVVFTEIDDFQFQSRSVWSEPSLWPDWTP